VTRPADPSGLRAWLRAERARLDAPSRIAAAEALLDTLEQLPEFLVDANVAGYWAVRGELPLNLVFAGLRAREQNYHLPLLAGQSLRFARWAPGAALQANRYGIPEPVCEPKDSTPPQGLDLVLVPLLGFDRRGHRLGSGAGYYDRTFAFLHGMTRPAHPVLVGIGYHFQEVSDLSAQSWDVAMDFIATDRELIDCASSEQGA
jgi:5-formyltetrahydrofolate cyclo-ligase